MTQAILLSRENDVFRAEIRAISAAELESATPGDDVVIDVHYSTINYKDGLALTNTSPVVRKWPMVAGIDAAGQVASSAHPKWKTGDTVVVNGWGLGETHWGGLAQRARVKGDWLVRIPAPLTPRDAMAIGTAGYTAALVGARPAGPRRDAQPRARCWSREPRAASDRSPWRCSRRSATRSSARPAKLHEADYLKALGAREVIDRSDAVRSRQTAAEGPLGRRR